MFCTRFGLFYGDRSYIILYTYFHKNSKKRVIYFWLGNRSPVDVKCAAALLANELGKEYGFVTEVGVG